MRFLWIFLAALPALSQDLKVACYNTESGDADPTVVAARIFDIDGVDIWGLSEVENQAWLDAFEEAAEEDEGANFESSLGTKGGDDRLAIVYDADRLELLEVFELEEINTTGRVRPALVAKFRLEGQEFYFMVNHLYRSRENERHQQATLLNAWAAQQDIPVIASGDYNFDWEVEGGDSDHDEGYDLMTAGDVFVWVRPDELVRSQMGGRYNSVLDFIFVSGAAKQWCGSSEILVVDGDEPDNNRISDHRPVLATFTLDGDCGSNGGGGGDGDLKRELKDQIFRVQTELNKLWELVDKMPDEEDNDH